MYVYVYISEVSRDFFGRPISVEGLGGMCPLMGPLQSPSGDQAVKLPEAPRS